MRSAAGLVDGLLRGRVWVACVGLLLVGIVFLNVSLLGLNSGIAVSADQAAQLRHQNAELRLEVAKLGSSERIQRVAESRGFVMPAPGDVTYLEADPDADARGAALALRKAPSGAAAEEVPSAAGATPDPAPATGTAAEDPAPRDPAADPVAGAPPAPPAG